MNIEILNDYITMFTREVVDSGFKRDLDDYGASLPSSQNNIVPLRDIAESILSVLDRLYDSDLPDSLRALLPSEGSHSFLAASHNVELRELFENTEIQQDEFFVKLTEFVDELKRQILQNAQEISSILEFVTPYLSADTTMRTEQDVATISIVFKEQRTISNLPEFAKTLTTWNKVLPVYHQLLKSESPGDVQIVEVQNGSIDLVINLNVDVAMDLAEVFKIGFKVFAAYLSYKNLAKPLVDTYYGNKKLITQEKEREKLLLENIGSAVKKKITAQHKRAKKADKGIDGSAVPKKAELVQKLVTSHIVKGNDFKILALPETHELDEGSDDSPDEIEDLRKVSLEARQQLRLVPPEAQQKLLEAYGHNDEEAE